jgi:hypothetical protein
MIQQGPNTQDFDIFEHHCVLARSIYQHYQLLFGSSSPEHRDLMSRTASIFFGDLSWVLRDRIILDVCKITDPADDARNNENLSIDFLLRHYGLNGERSPRRPPCL